MEDKTKRRLNSFRGGYLVGKHHQKQLGLSPNAPPGSVDFHLRDTLIYTVPPERKPHFGRFCAYWKYIWYWYISCGHTLWCFSLFLVQCCSCKLRRRKESWYFTLHKLRVLNVLISWFMNFKSLFSLTLFISELVLLPVYVVCRKVMFSVMYACLTTRRIPIW